ncbi:MAG: dihydrofolate reductase, partial [Sphingobacteriales bacterium]
KKLAASDPLITGWRNSALINTIEDIKALKRSEGKNIQVWGSSKLIQLLLAEDLVDELKLKIHPIILGKGKNLFADNGFPASFTLMKSVVTTSGVIIADYKRSGEIKTGTAGA